MNINLNTQTYVSHRRGWYVIKIMPFSMITNASCILKMFWLSKIQKPTHLQPSTSRRYLMQNYITVGLLSIWRDLKFDCDSIYFIVVCNESCSFCDHSPRNKRQVYSSLTGRSGQGPSEKWLLVTVWINFIIHIFKSIIQSCLQMNKKYVHCIIKLHLIRRYVQSFEDNWYLIILI